MIPPYDHYGVMAGQGTLALELMQQVPNLDAIVVCIGGGGLVCAIYLIRSRTAHAHKRSFAHTHTAACLRTCAHSNEIGFCFIGMHVSNN